MYLKKTVFTILLIFISFLACLSQYSVDSSKYDYVRPQKFEVNKYTDNYIIIGIGNGGYYPYYGLSYSASPNILLGYERTVLHNAWFGEIAVSSIFSYKQIASRYENYLDSYTYQQEWNYYMVGLRAVYYLTESPIENLEPYVGVTEGYYFTGFKFSSTDPNYNNPLDPGYSLSPNNYPNFFAPGIFAGVRSHISKRFIVWSELGYGYSTLTFGFSFRI